MFHRRSATATVVFLLLMWIGSAIPREAGAADPQATLSASVRGVGGSEAVDVIAGDPVALTLVVSNGGQAPASFVPPTTTGPYRNIVAQVRRLGGAEFETVPIPFIRWGGRSAGGGGPSVRTLAAGEAEEFPLRLGWETLTPREGGGRRSYRPLFREPGEYQVQVELRAFDEPPPEGAAPEGIEPTRPVIADAVTVRIASPEGEEDRAALADLLAMPEA